VGCCWSPGTGVEPSFVSFLYIPCIGSLRVLLALCETLAVFIMCVWSSPGWICVRFAVGFAVDDTPALHGVLLDGSEGDLE
jgi:hypothetical protein